MTSEEGPNAVGAISVYIGCNCVVRRDCEFGCFSPVDLEILAFFGLYWASSELEQISQRFADLVASWAFPPLPVLRAFISEAAAPRDGTPNNAPRVPHARASASVLLLVYAYFVHGCYPRTPRREHRRSRA